MKNKTLLILCAVTVLVILAAAISSKLRAPQKSIEKTVLFPELADRINDVSRIVIKGFDNTVTLQQSGGQWFIASADNYPASFDKIRQTVINMSLLRLEEEKTDNPDFYSRLGVEDPETEDASSVLIILEDPNNQSLATIIVGKRRQSSGSKPGLYVRKPDETQSLLVEGMLDISAEQADWFERQLFDIPVSEVKNVVIHYADGNTFEIYKDIREQTAFDIRGQDNVPSASKLIVNRIASGLEEMRADGVRAAEKFSFVPEETIRTTVTTFDGLIIESRLASIDDKAYAQFTVQYDESAPSEADNEEDDISKDVREYASTLNDRLSPWVYTIPDFKYEALTTNIDNLKQSPGN